MGWQVRNKPQVVKMTKKLAQEWSEMDEVREDRPLSERRLMVYEKVLKAGEFRPVNWAKVYIKEMEQYYRVNGKHTSTLFAVTDLSKVQEIIAVIEDYECDTVEDAAKLYSTFDSHIQARNQSDINMMFAASIPELREMNSRFVGLVVGAINYWKAPGTASPTDTARVTSAEKAEVLFDEVEFALWLDKLIGHTHKAAMNHLYRVPVVASMRGTYAKSKAAATEFWTAVRDETGAKPDLPDRKLSKWLTVMRVHGGAKGNVPNRFKVMPREFYVKCIHAWNAWRKGEATNLQYYAAAKIPAFV